MATLHEDQYTFLIMSCSDLLKIKNADIISKENQTTHFMFIFFFIVLFMR